MQEGLLVLAFFHMQLLQGEEELALTVYAAFPNSIFLNSIKLVRIVAWCVKSKLINDMGLFQSQSLILYPLFPRVIP